MTGDDWLHWQQSPAAFSLVDFGFSPLRLSNAAGSSWFVGIPTSSREISVPPPRGAWRCRATILTANRHRMPLFGLHVEYRLCARGHTQQNNNDPHP